MLNTNKLIKLKLFHGFLFLLNLKFLSSDNLSVMGIGDWGLGIGPIPNPQSPIPIILVVAV